MARKNLRNQNEDISCVAPLEPLLAKIQKSPSIGFALLGRTLRYEFVNNALASMNRVPSKAHLGATLRVILADTAKKVEPVFDRVFSAGKAVLNYEFSGEMPSRVGEAHWIVSYFPLASTAHSVNQVAALVLDITDLRRLQRRFGELLQQPLHLLNSLTSTEDATGAPLVTSSQSLVTSARNANLLESGLTGREVEVLGLLASGSNNKQVAYRLGLSIRTRAIVEG